MNLCSTRTALVVGLMLSFANAYGSTQGISSVESKFNHFFALTEQSIEMPQPQRLAKIKASYYSNFDQAATPSKLAHLNDDDVALLYRAAEVAEFYLEEPAYLNDMEDTLQELESRKAATEDQRAAFFRALIGLRRFQTAAEYFGAHPSIRVEAVPKVAPLEKDLKQPIVYAVTKDAHSLRPEYVDVARGIHLIVVSHPLCAFSRRAMSVMASDAELRPVLQYTTWLAPVDQRLNLDVVSAWNAQHSDTPVVIARRRSDWPMFDEWGTPHFYLFRDGRMIGDFAGWPLEGNRGNREKLVELLTEGGLLQRSANTK
ncbi:hypothetical protein [Cognatiluteimonas profundi]|uniref:hypothetical protein n=1 Tax=Cognatiluteimonas profundi TaxID=2594501 RepID=UPI00131CBB2F|nr:hypothetical protein [Lysobacter profundi]